MTERRDFGGLSSDPEALRAYVFGDGPGLDFPVPIEDPSRRMPMEERGARAHLPDGTVVSIDDYYGWPPLP